MQEFVRQPADENQQISLGYRRWILCTGVNSYRPLKLVMSDTIQSGHFVYEDTL
jgi:hypothetical protein